MPYILHFDDSSFSVSTATTSTKAVAGFTVQFLSVHAETGVKAGFFSLSIFGPEM
jgi:hypothetical protein